MQMIIAIGSDINDQLSSLYVGHDFQAAQDAVTAANPAIGYIFRDPMAATIAVRATPPPPAITALTPATGPAGTDILVSITGTGFDTAPTVTIGAAYGLVPTSVTATELKVLLSGTANIQFPGVLAMSVQNSDGQTSNALDFTVT